MPHHHISTGSNSLGTTLFCVLRILIKIHLSSDRSGLHLQLMHYPYNFTAGISSVASLPDCKIEFPIYRLFLNVIFNIVWIYIYANVIYLNGILHEKWIISDNFGILLDNCDKTCISICIVFLKTVQWFIFSLKYINFELIYSGLIVFHEFNSSPNFFLNKKLW